jgi:hypothetical protein
MMASKKDLAATALLLAAALGLAVQTDGLNHDELTDLVRDLKAKKVDAETHTQADVVEDEELELAIATVEVKAHPYSIAEGMSVTTKKGMLSHGDEIKAEYLGGGQDALDSLVKRKVVVKA